jgi:copper chaperone CopZ
MKNVILSVPDMNCDGCADKVRSALSSLTVIRNVEVSLEDKTVLIELTDDVTLDAIISVVAAAGYKATLIG